MGKSRWEGKDGNVVNVETLALEFYEKQGYKGCALKRATSLDAQG